MLDICNKNHNLNETQNEGANKVNEGAWVWENEEVIHFLNFTF